MNEQFIIADGVKWYITDNNFNCVTPLCPKHHLELYMRINNPDACILKCEECNDFYKFSREFNNQKQYILDKLNSKAFKNVKFINLDDEAIPIAESKIASKDNKYFITSLLTQSKVGLRLVVYVGEKGRTDKTQIFVEPSIRRLAFDQTDIHPSDIFLKLEGTFNDGTSASIKRKK